MPPGELIEKMTALGEILLSSSRFFFMLSGEIIKGFAKFESSEVVSIIKPFSSNIAIILDELSFPEIVVKLIFLEEKKLTVSDISIIIVIIDKKKANDLMKTLKKIDIFRDL